MVKSLPYVKFLNLLLQEARSNKLVMQETFHHHLDAMLAFILNGEDMGDGVTASDIVSINVFGAPPTVKRRIQELVDCGFIKVNKIDKRRRQFLTVSDYGINHLKQISSLMVEAVSG